jgi:hypothetical protein
VQQAFKETEDTSEVSALKPNTTLRTLSGSLNGKELHVKDNMQPLVSSNKRATLIADKELNTIQCKSLSLCELSPACLLYNYAVPLIARSKRLTSRMFDHR